MKIPKNNYDVRGAGVPDSMMRYTRLLYCTADRLRIYIKHSINYFKYVLSYYLLLV